MDIILIIIINNIKATKELLRLISKIKDLSKVTIIWIMDIILIIIINNIKTNKNLISLISNSIDK
jgi:hypothetical protein